MWDLVYTHVGNLASATMLVHCTVILLAPSMGGHCITYGLSQCPLKVFLNQNLTKPSDQWSKERLY